MTITDRYLQEILPCIAAVGGGDIREKKGGYETPCPFCCYRQKKESKRKKRVGMFFPDDKKYSYRFNCYVGCVFLDEPTFKKFSLH